MRLSLRDPATLVGLAVGGALLGLAATTLAGGSDFQVGHGGWRVWRPERAEAIRKLLGNAHLQAITDKAGVVIPNTYLIKPSRGTGRSALDDVRAMQGRGSLVTTTTNLLQPGTEQTNPRGLAEVPAAETAMLQFGSEADGIAALPIGI